MERFDCVVVGASAVGGVCSRELARRGVSTAVLEEHATPGKFHKCSGIMSKKGLESLGVDLDGIVLNKVRGARFFAGNAESRVLSSQTQAYVIDRQAFDERAVAEAVNAGAKLFTSSRASNMSRKGKKLLAGTGNRSFESDAIVGCDGISSSVARAFAFPPLGAFVSAWEAEFDGAEVGDTESVSIFLDNRLYKGFFGWAIPAGDERVRVGFATTDLAQVRHSKPKFLETPAVSGMVKRAMILREFNYVIPVRVRDRTQDGNVLLAGDAAGQVKSTTGGGVVFGGKCAMVAAEQVAGHVKEGKKLDYERAWRKKYGRTLLAHRILHKVHNAGIPGLAQAGVWLVGLGLGRLLSRFGDMDFIVATR